MFFFDPYISSHTFKVGICFQIYTNIYRYRYRYRYIFIHIYIYKYIYIYIYIYCIYIFFRYIYLMLTLLLQDFSTLCVMHKFWQILISYLVSLLRKFLTYSYQQCVSARHVSKCICYCIYNCSKNKENQVFSRFHIQIVVILLLQDFRFF